MSKNDDKEKVNQAEEPQETKETAREDRGKEAKGGNKEKERIQKLEKDLAAAKDAVAKEKADYMRLLAEFDTFRRRTAEERLNMIDSASADIIKGMLPVLDACEQAVKMMENAADCADKEGINLIFGKLMSYLKSKGLDVIKSMGETFDTDFHEAVAQVPVDDEARKGKVFDVVQTGYTLSGKVIRYAKVVVGI